MFPNHYASHIIHCFPSSHILPSQHKKASNHHANLPWKCTVLHCNHLGNTWKPLVLMTRHLDYCPSASEGDNQSVRSSAPVVSRCFPGGYNVKLYISRGRLAWWLLAFFAQCMLSELANHGKYMTTQAHKNGLNHSATYPIAC